ncbi:tetratricopeptide repeat protein [Jiella pacifica]|uniref:Uncharacterized protein n=1 Tax=Jiella pacifica TaxID=2696469 RepID=A0A6N9SV95_9HYPH|nr:tetratricopeptide repeat protein [Jiella pacifica]NDW02924.1 hypothetical protein [Jiella pacifica]
MTKADPAELLKQGVNLRNSGDLRAAETALSAAKDAMPEHFQPSYELGILYQNEKRKAEALAAFSYAYERDPSEPRVVMAFALHLVTDGHTQAALDVLEMARPRKLEMMRNIGLASHFVRFATDFRLEQAQALADQARAAYLPLKDVAARIQNAVQNKAPFAMIRFGDGEGTWLHRSTRDEVRYSALYERNRQEFWNVWFGADQASEQGAFYATLSDLRHLAKTADIIGAPSINWIKHEYEIASLRGVPGTLNALRCALEVKSRQTALYAESLHYQLDSSGFLRELLNSQTRIGVMSCHPAIVDFMKAEFGLKNVDYYPIPGEPSRRHLHGDSTITGRHFPDYFRKTMSLIDQNDHQRGQVVLVGGGILGKLYALRLKQAGAIALDIGSLADKWMGKKTRPGF